MTYKELLEATKGMNLDDMGVSLGKQSNRSESLSCYQDGDTWVMRLIDERQRARITRGSEEVVCEITFENIKALSE